MKRIMFIVTIMVFFLPLKTISIPSADINKDGTINWIDALVVIGAVLMPDNFVREADLNSDLKVDAEDIAVFYKAYVLTDEDKRLLFEAIMLIIQNGRKYFPCDFNNDGTVDIRDLLAFSLGGVPFDVTGDGKVDEGDLRRLGLGRGFPRQARGNDFADLNKDGEVNEADRTIFEKYFGIVYFARNPARNPASPPLRPVILKSWGGLKS